MPKKQSNDIRDYNHIDLLYPSKYVKGAELGGKDVTVTIESIEPRHELQRTDKSKDYKPILNFKEAEKAMVLNKTNAQTIAAMYGPEAMEWIGKRITLYCKKVEAFGKMHDAIRIRAKVPAAKAARPAAESPPEDRPEPEHNPDTGEIATGNGRPVESFDTLIAALNLAPDEPAAAEIWSEHVDLIASVTDGERLMLDRVYETKGRA